MATRAGISLRVTGEGLIPSEVSARVGLSPDRSFARGDQFDSRQGARRRSSAVWAIDSRDHVSSADIAQHAKWILQVLQPARSGIEEIKEDPSFRVSLGVWWEPESGQGGFTLKASTVSALCDFCNEVDFYFA
ncbi:MAG: DUF4279 domain-containing protein [Thermoanaerobaculaceae bacterium]